MWRNIHNTVGKLEPCALQVGKKNQEVIVAQIFVTITITKLINL